MKEYTDKDEFLPLVQHYCLGIVKEIDRICREHSIHYSLCGGSVIGAHLFQGFIPWDDDIDLMMTRNDYNKLLDVFPKEAATRFNLLNYKFQKDVAVPTLFTRIEDLNTEVEEEIAGHKRTGHVFVDITVMDNISSSFMHKCAFWYGSYTYLHLYRWNGMTPGTPWKKFLFKLLSGSSDKQKTLRLYENYEKHCSRKRDLKTKYCAELLSAAYSNYIYERSLFDEYIDTPFAGTNLMVVRRYMDYLYARYHKREFTRDVPPNLRFNSHMKSFRITE